MEPQVCVNCLNKKSVNTTTNRLVTESCGHVKCMDCLIHEKAGCVACADRNTAESEVGPQPSKYTLSDAETVAVQTDFPLQHFILSGDDSEKKKKLETSHIRIVTDENGRSYFCTFCEKKFQARSQVAYHAYCNGQRKPYQCPECSKGFATHSHFKYHMRVHRNERTYACELCGDSFFQMSKLQRHKLKHTKEKKYTCTECNKAFNNLTSLRKHGLTHSEERPYGCKICGRCFRDSSNFRKHVAKHNGSGGCAGCAGGCACGSCSRRARAARAHVCPRCPQAFHARKDMRRHAAVHDDSKPFRCKVCNRRFRRKDNLERHIRNTHPNHAPASAVLRDPTPDATPLKPEKLPEKIYENNEKIKLEILNPLPPLPIEVMQKHMHTEKEIKDIKDVKDVKDNKVIKDTNDIKSIIEDVSEKSLTDKIKEANNARKSVIFGPMRSEEKRASSPKNEYVHKIRRAHVMPSCRIEVQLPPIDARKLVELEQKNNQNNLDVGAPPEKFRELYKKILYEKSEKEAAAAAAEEQKQSASPRLHWRKMKLNSNW